MSSVNVEGSINSVEIEQPVSNVQVETRASLVEVTEVSSTVEVTGMPVPVPGPPGEQGPPGESAYFDENGNLSVPGYVEAGKGVKAADEPAPASQELAGTRRYRETATYSIEELCMKTGANQWEWVPVQQYEW